jgi:uncharacterized protein (TIGR03118 family)
MRKILLSGTLVCACASWCGAANKFVQHNLVSDLPGVADHLDACLVNPWGIVATATSPFWVSLNGSGLAGIYDGNGNPNTLLVNVPGPAGAAAPGGQCRSATLGPGAASGVIANDTTAFPIGGAPASFIFASEQGVIVGWNGAAGNTGAIMADRSAAGTVYKGLATATRSEGPLLYAADFGNGKVDVFDGQMNLLSLTGAFTDPKIPAGFAPFNIANLDGSLFVSYAKQDAEHHDDVAGAGNGYVDVYDLNGVLLQRLVSAGPLNSPWGMTIAPSSFGDFGGDLLVGNFGDGAINVFDPVSGEFFGTLQDGAGATIHISGLWGLTFGNGNRANPGAAPSGGDANSLYFAAGIAGPDTVESHGLLGSIQPAPAITSNGVVNSASFLPPISPGAFTTIFGIGLAATTRTWTTADLANGKLPVQLDGVSVTVDGIPAYVYYVSPSQIDIIVPADSNTGPVPVVVTNSGVASASAAVAMQTTSPAFFSLGNYVLAMHANGSLVGPASLAPGATPAKPGEVIVAYGTGFGATNPAVDGLVLSSAASLAAAPSITIGGAVAPVQFGGLISAGLDQLNITIPALPAGSSSTVDLPIAANAGSSSTPVALLVSVQAAN